MYSTSKTATTATASGGDAIVLLLFLAMIFLSLVVTVAIFNKLAKDKGHSVGVYIFLLALFATPITAGIYVCALPDLSDHKKPQTQSSFMDNYK